MKVSVKQLELFGTKTRRAGALNGCPRKHAFQYFERDLPRAPKNEAMQLGIDFHAACQALVETGRLPEQFPAESNVGRMARAAFKHKQVLRGVTWTAEKEYTFPWTTLGGLSVDIELTPDLHTDSPAPLLIDDWKSCASRKYSLKTLVDDVEANVYAVGGMTLWGRIACEARWIYVDKHTYESWPIDHKFYLYVSRAWMHEELDGTIELLHTMWLMRPRALDLPHDVEACEGIGKQCDYLGHCEPEKQRDTIITLEQVLRAKGSIT